jgi:hypothetical protein
MTQRPLVLATLAIVLFGPSAVPLAEGDATEHLVRHFTVTIDQGPSAGLAVFGLLTIDVDVNRGTFTGTLTPAEDATTGRPLTSVLFRQNGSSRTPDPTVTEIQVRGSIEGQTLSMVMVDVGGPGKHIFGVGTTENDPGRRLRRDPGLVGGPAVGPQAGDRGDWLLTDGGGGGTTGGGGGTTGGGTTLPPSTGTGAYFNRNANSFVITAFAGNVLVTQLTVPAGNYIIMAKVQVAVAPTGPFAALGTINCFLTFPQGDPILGGDADLGTAVAASGVQGTIALLGDATFTGTGHPQVLCNGNGNISNSSLTAITVNGVTRQ